MKNEIKGLRVPQFFRFIIPLIDALRELGGSSSTSEAIDLVIDKLEISEEELAVTIKSGGSKIRNQIQWARLLLVKNGYLDSSQRGVWSLTEKGLNENITPEDLLKIYEDRKQREKERRAELAEQKTVLGSDKMDVNDDIKDESLSITADYRTELLGKLQSISPSGFERICQRLLREAGFEQVKVTGKSSDGGIDGIGILQVNPFVSFRVLFQCKRYKGSVSASQVRDFRGAMLGRADKGIILTTGSFTREAKKEARRDGVTPIELVDSDKIVEMFESLELGLKPVKTFEVDDKFFDEFRE